MLEETQQHANGKKRLQGPRCKGTTKAGQRCQALAGKDGLCSAHRDPERMRELGKLSAKARARPNPARVHPALGEYLLAEVHPERIWHALETAMLGQSESARVQASRVLMDALAAARPEGCPACAEREREREAVSERANEKIIGLVVTSIAAILTGSEENAPGLARMAADKLPDDLKARIAQLR